MATYRLQYFDIRARGELIRLIFAQCGVEYEDDRGAGSNWPEIKKSESKLSLAPPLYTHL